MPEMYADDELKRRAQIGMLGGDDPLSVSKITGGTNGGFVSPPKSGTMPIGGYPSILPVEPQRETPSASNRNRPAMPGWDAGNWADPNMHSVKYDAGDLLYGLTKPSEVGYKVRSDEFQKRFPGATFDGKDNIDFAGALSDGTSGTPVGLIDVLMAADHEGDTSNGVWWGAPDGSPQGQGAQTSQTGINPAGDNSALAKIMAELQATQNDDQSPAEREAMLALLNGGI